MSNEKTHGSLSVFQTLLYVLVWYNLFFSFFLSPFEILKILLYNLNIYLYIYNNRWNWEKIQLNSQFCATCPNQNSKKNLIRL